MAVASTGAKGSLVPMSGPLEYTTLAQPARMEVDVKKSRFLVTAWWVYLCSVYITACMQHENTSLPRVASTHPKPHCRPA